VVGGGLWVQDPDAAFKNRRVAAGVLPGAAELLQAMVGFGVVQRPPGEEGVAAVDARADSPVFPLRGRSFPVRQ
jgi:hypothetical protein